MPLEVRRRLVHAAGAAIPAGYLLDRGVLETGLITWGVVRAVCVAGLLAAAALEAARLYGGLEHAIFEELTREYEQEKVAGYALYVLSGTAVVLVFDPAVAVPALFMLTVGDPVGGVLSGEDFRRVDHPNVFGVGPPRVFLGTFVVCFALAFPFVPVAAAVLGAAGAALADGVKPAVAGYVVDDNLTIPVVSAVLMWAAVAFL